jgi:hypothetical protein
MLIQMVAGQFGTSRVRSYRVRTQPFQSEAQAVRLRKRLPTPCEALRLGARRH